jgi:hypothetical protein
MVATYFALKQAGLVVWLASLFVAMIGVFAIAAVQTYSICGLSIGEMQADPSRNCLYASNPIGETFIASVVFSGLVVLSIFFVSTIIYVMARERKS